MGWRTLRPEHARCDAAQPFSTALLPQLSYAKAREPHHERVHAAGVDDSAPAVLEHVRHGGLGGVKGGGQAHRDDVVPLVLGEGLDGGHVLDAGVVAAGTAAGGRGDVDS